MHRRGGDVRDVAYRIVGFIIILCASLRDTSRPCDTHPAVRLRTVTRISPFFFFCLEKKSPPLLPHHVRLFNYSTRCCCCRRRPSVFIKRNGLCDRRRFPFIYHFINNRSSAASVWRLHPTLSGIEKKKKDKSFSLSHNKIDERHFVTEMSTGFFFFSFLKTNSI